MKRLLSLCLIFSFTYSLSAFELSDDDKKLYKRSEQYYRERQWNSGHLMLKKIIEHNVGNVDISKVFLALIMNKSMEDRIYDKWTEYGIKHFVLS